MTGWAYFNAQLKDKRMGKSRAAPQITALAVSAITDTTATVTWTTDGLTTSQVGYGLAPLTVQQTALDGSLVTSHSVSLTGLTSGTFYAVRALSRAATGELAISDLGFFTTLRSGLALEDGTAMLLEDGTRLVLEGS